MQKTAGALVSGDIRFVGYSRGVPGEEYEASFSAVRSASSYTFARWRDWRRGVTFSNNNCVRYLEVH